MVGFAMQYPTPFFTGFHLPTLGRKPRFASLVLADKLDQLKQNSFSQLGDFLAILFRGTFFSP
jgi:hypothetical protein